MRKQFILFEHNSQYTYVSAKKGNPSVAVQVAPQVSTKHKRRIARSIRNFVKQIDVIIFLFYFFALTKLVGVGRNSIKPHETSEKQRLLFWATSKHVCKIQ